MFTLASLVARLGALGLAAAEDAVSLPDDQVGAGSDPLGSILLAMTNTETVAIDLTETKVDPGSPRHARQEKRFPSVARFAPPLFAILGGCVGAVLSLQLWRAHPGIPFEYSGDALSHGMHMQQIVQNGWYWTDTRLGAPFAQHMQDWPMGDVVSLLVARFFALFTGNWAVVQNAVFLSSFPLCAFTAWWALQKFGVRSWTASVLGILFALLPYHFVRGENHLFLSNYFVVPLGVYLAMRVLGGEPLFRSAGVDARRISRKPTMQTLLLCVVIGFGGIYYAAFTLIAVFAAGVVRALQRKTNFVSSLAIMATILGVVLIAVAPALIYHAEHGPNLRAADRAAYESDVYGLKLAQMVAPVPGHRIEKLDALQEQYLDTFPLPGERGSAALGVIGAGGFLFALGLTIASLVRRATPSNAESRMRHLSLLAIVGWVVAGVGGLSTYIGLLVTGDIRSWNRMSTFIALCALGCVGLLIDAGLRRIRRDRRRRLAPIVLVAVLVIGFLDQVTPRWTPAYASVDKTFLSDQQYFESIEKSLDTGSSVFVLPRVEFPESPAVVRVRSNDQLVPYLHTDTLQWSFGGLEGRLESAWQDRLPFDDVAALSSDLAAAGFSGVLVFRNGYADNGADLEADIERFTGAKPVVNREQTYAFFDLRSFAAGLNPDEREARKQALLYPAVVVNREGFYDTERDETIKWNWADGTSGSLDIENGATSSLRSEVTFTVEAATDSTARFDVMWPDGSRTTKTSSGDPVTFSHTGMVPKGASKVRIETDAASLPSGVDARDLRFRLLDADVEAAR